MVYISGGNELLDPMEILGRLGVKTGSHLADLGCGGAGHFVIPATKLVGDQTEVYAVDILKSVLKSVTSIARLGGIANIRPIWSNLEVLGSTRIPASSLDFACLINILFLSKHHPEIVKEAHRLLRKDGKLLVIDWLKNSAVFGPKQADRVDPEKIKKISQDLNLKLIDSFEAGHHHFGLIFQK